MVIKKLGTVGILGVFAAATLGMLVHAHSQQPQSPLTPAAGQGAGQGSKPVTQQKYSHVSQTDGYRFVPGWPQKPAEAVWGAMSSIAVDASGNIWTLNRGNIPVQVYRPDGTLVRMWGQGMFKSIHHIRFEKDGNLWITDNGANTVRKFTPDGKLLMTLGTAGQPGYDAGYFDGPTDVAIAANGDLFISDGYGNCRIAHYDKTGKFVKSIGKEGPTPSSRCGVGPGEFQLPHGIVIDSQGLLYVAERSNSRIQVLDQSGKSLRMFSNIICPWSITITPNDEIYAVGSTPMQWWETFDIQAAARGEKGGQYEMDGVPPKDQIVVKFDTTGRVLGQWAFPKGPEGKLHEPGQVTWLHGVGVTANGDIYLGDITGRTAQKFEFLKANVPTPFR
jgi:hypothetical protein